MTSLYDQNPSAWNRIAEKRPKTAELAKKMASYKEMESALGYGNFVVCKWVDGTNRVSFETERRAAAYLRASSIVSLPEPPQPKHEIGGHLVMIACTSEQLAKLMKVAAVLGVEVIEV